MPCARTPGPQNVPVALLRLALGRLMPLRKRRTRRRRTAGRQRGGRQSLNPGTACSGYRRGFLETRQRVRPAAQMERRRGVVPQSKQLTARFPPGALQPGQRLPGGAADRRSRSGIPGGVAAKAGLPRRPHESWRGGGITRAPERGHRGVPRRTPPPRVESRGPRGFGERTHGQPAIQRGGCRVPHRDRTRPGGPSDPRGVREFTAAIGRRGCGQRGISASPCPGSR